MLQYKFVFDCSLKCGKLYYVCVVPEAELRDMGCIVVSTPILVHLLSCTKNLALILIAARFFPSLMNCVAPCYKLDTLNYFYSKLL